jgi:septation ring formation regulator EzrA
MSQNNIPLNLPSVEKLIQRVSAAEKTHQKEIRISITECRDLISELAIITVRLGQTVQQINENLKSIQENTKTIDVRFDGGGFN